MLTFVHKYNFILIYPSGLGEIPYRRWCLIV